MKNKSIISIIMVVIILMVTKLSGLFRDAVVVSVYGASLFSDGFFLALSIVLTLYALIGKAITLYLISKFDQSDVDYLIMKSFVLKSSVLALVFIGCYHLLSDAMIHMLYTGVIDANLKRLFASAVYASIFIPAIYTLVAYHQSKNRFYVTTLIGLAFNLTMIVSVLVRYFGPYMFIIGMMIQLMMLFFRVEIKKIFAAKLEKIKIKEFLPISAIAITMAFEQLNVLIDRRYISIMGSGELTLLDLGSKVSFMFMGIVVLSVTTVIYPKLNQYYNDKRYEDFLGLMHKTTIVMVVLSILGIIVIAVSAEFIIDILFVRGVLYAEDVKNIAFYLRIYSLTLLPLSIREMMIRFMILRGKEGVLFGTSLIGLCINVFLSMKSTSSITIVYGSIVSIVISTLFLAVSFCGELKTLKVDNNWLKG